MIGTLPDRLALDAFLAALDPSHVQRARQPAHILQRVMQPSFTTKPNGTGLGLWVSQAFMADHGGTVDVASPPGGGTLVTLRFPFEAGS